MCSSATETRTRGQCFVEHEGIEDGPQIDYIEDDEDRLILNGGVP